MNKINSHLTKEMLKQNGIYEVYWDEDVNEWWIDRYWYKNRSKEKTHRRIKITISIRKHKYTQDKSYPIVTFSNKNKVTCLPLARFLYAWFHGEVKEGEVVDHIDNNAFNNRLENLQVLTPEQNLAKRFIDNPNANRNQWDAINKEK